MGKKDIWLCVGVVCMALIIALAVMLLVALSIIAFFNFYLSVARDVSFKRGFFVMAGISTFVALVSYGFGYLLR